MKLARYLGFAAALSAATAPAVAAAANPAAGLSLRVPRAATPSAHSSNFSGTEFLIAGGALVLLIAAILAIESRDEDNPTSP